ncbi:hypothetical protein GGI42DRAFT_323004 [Trichoderma sp. SZMC 28013]
MINFYVYVDIYAENWQMFDAFSSVLIFLKVLPYILSFSTSYFTFGLSTSVEKFGVYELSAESDVLPTSIEAQREPETDHMISHVPYTVLFLITSLPTTFAYFILYTAVSLIALISGIFWTEETIRVNNIDLSAATITSSGQLMSLIVTIFTSIPIWWTILLTLIAKWNKKRAKTQ